MKCVKINTVVKDCDGDCHECIILFTIPDNDSRSSPGITGGRDARHPARQGQSGKW